MERTAHARKGLVTAHLASFVFVLISIGLIAVPRSAYAASVLLGDGSAVPGQAQVALPLSFQPASGEQISVFIVNVHFDPAVAQWDSIVLEPAVIALGKQVETHFVASGHVRLIIYGLDRQALSEGAVAKCLMRVLTSAVPGGSVVSLRDGVGADPNGIEQSLTLFDGRLWIDVLADTTAPTLTLTSPLDGAHFASGTNVSVAGTATDDQPGVSVRVNGTAVSLGTGGTFTHSLTGLAAGTYTITVDAVDAAGNHRTLTRSVTIDPAPTPEPTPTATDPIVRILKPVEASTMAGPSVTVEFTVQNADVRDAPGATHLHIKIDGGTSWHVYNTNPFVLPVSVANGGHTVAVMLADNATHTVVPAGETGDTYEQVTFTVGETTTSPPPPTDTTAPTLTLTSPLDGAHYASGSSVTVAGTATDDQPGVVVKVNGTSVTLGSGGAFSYSLAGLATGTYTITVDAVDAAGNHRTLTRSVTIDPAPTPSPSAPTLKILSPLEGSTVGNPVYLKFSVDGVDLRSGNQYAHVHIRLDDGSVSHVYNNQPFALGNLKAGTHTVSVMLADNVNHLVWPGTKVKRVTFTVK